MLTRSMRLDREEQKLLPKLVGRDELIREYYRVLRTGDAAPGTIRNYIGAVIRCDDYAQATYNCSVVDMDARKMANYLDSLRTITMPDGTIREASHAYRSMVWTALRGFFDYVGKARGEQANPVEVIKKPKQVLDEVKRYFFTPDELMLLLNTAYAEIDESAPPRVWASQVRNYALLVLLCYSGARISAFLNVDVSDIDWENRTIRLIEKRDRMYDFSIDNHRILDALRAYIKVRPVLTAGAPQEAALFLSKSGRRLTTPVFSRWLEKMESVLIGNRHLAPHKLRASFATNMMKECNDITMVQALMRHSNVRTTELYVVKDAPQAAVDAAKVMERLLG